MKILQTCHRFYPNVGGTEELVMHLSRNFVDMGHDVTVITSQEPDTLNEEYMNGIRVIRIPLIHFAGKRIPKGYVQKVLSEKWDIVHLQGQRVWSSDWLFPHLKKISCPKIFTPIGFYQLEMVGGPINWLYYHCWLTPMLKKFDKIIALTEKEKRTMLSWDIPEENITSIPVGIEPKDFEKLPKGFKEKYGITSEFVILYVGGFYENKRIDRLIKAMKKIEEDYILVIVGKDVKSRYNRNYCEKLSKELNVNVKFTGKISREDVLSAYQCADVFVLASQYEGFGIVLLESMASGVPFVSTDAGAAKDLAENGCGFIVKDEEEMGKTIKTLLNDAEMRKEMGKKGRIYVKEHAWDRIAKKHLSLYKSLQ